jgi:hypothetical protein
MMKKLALVVSIAMIAALAACSAGITVTSDWDPSFDFSQSQTFVLLENDIPGINRFIEERITTAIAADLTKAGLRQVNNVGDADLAVGFDVATENRTTYQTVHSGMTGSGWHSSSARWGMSTGTSRTTQRNYTVGTLVIAVFETSGKELVWEAAGAGTVNPTSDPNESQKRINDKVEQILRDFPAKA